MPSDAVTVAGRPGEPLRVNLGGPAGRDTLRDNLHFLAYTLTPNSFMG